MKLLKNGAAFSGGIICSLSHAAATEYNLDPQHTSVVIAWNHFGFSHPTADISDVSGQLAFDKENPEKAQVNVTCR